jgi:hypothetical protein
MNADERGCRPAWPSAFERRRSESVTAQIEKEVGKKSSIGQVIGVIVREYLTPRPAEYVGRAKENRPKDLRASVPAWAPHLDEIEAAVKQIKEDIETAR